MKVTDKDVNYRIEPYTQEAVLQFIIDSIVIVLITVIFVIAKFPAFACVLVDLLYLFLLFFFIIKL